MPNEVGYTVVEVAEKLKITKESVFARIRRGSLTVVKVGGKNYVKPEELDRVLTLRYSNVSK